MLAKGEFDKQEEVDGIEVWISQQGPFGNVNTAFIDRASNTVVIIDPYSAKKWLSALKSANLTPTHILITHTHRDHTSGVKKMLKSFPEIELWGHQEANYPNLLARVLFRHLDFTHTWNHPAHSIQKWTAGGITLHATHTPGHAPGHLSFHGHGVFHAGDLLFTQRSGRVDLPGGDAESQWRSVTHAREILKKLPSDWRLIPGHNYEWIDGTERNWVSLAAALKHNLALNSKSFEDFDNLDFLRFDD
jgi:glyoxylase-like metal-dependent hydrolase (beta-lactamase superfamily II)